MKKWVNKTTGTEYSIKVSPKGNKEWSGKVTSSLSGERHPLYENTSLRADTREEAEEKLWDFFSILYLH